MSDAVEPLDLGAIRERVGAATDGPWVEWTERDPNGALRSGISPASDPEVDVCITPQTPQGIEDSAFIAHARQDVPALLAEVERLRAARQPAHAPSAAEDREALDGHELGEPVYDDRQRYAETIARHVGWQPGVYEAAERLLVLAARQPAPVDAKTTTEWGVRRETKHFGTVIDPSFTREGALRAAEALRDPAVINHTPSAVAVSRTVITTPWREAQDRG